MRERKAVYLYGRGGGENLGLEEEKTLIRIIIWEKTIFNLENGLWPSENVRIMTDESTQEIKAFAAKSSYVSSTPETYMWKEGKQLLNNKYNKKRIKV